jgi:hypothetical protein
MSRAGTAIIVAGGLAALNFCGLRDAQDELMRFAT